MAIRKILVILSGGDNEVAALDTAFALAGPLGAHVVGLFVRTDPRDNVPLQGEGISGALVDQILDAAKREAADRSKEARRIFETARHKVGAVTVTSPKDAMPGNDGNPVLTAEFAEATGPDEMVAVPMARTADLCVLPRPSGAKQALQMVRLEAILMSSGRPILMTPAAPITSIGRSVAIAWNGTAEAARAVALNHALIAGAKEVHILTAEMDKADLNVGRDLADYLSWHGIGAYRTKVATQGDSVGAALLKAAESVGADVLIMGAYGHSRLRELILGGVTLHVLTHADMPVLLAH